MHESQGSTQDIAGLSNGSFGELLQGILPNDRHFLVTLPISLKAKAVFKFSNSNHLFIYPTEKRKVNLFCGLFATYYNLKITGNLSIETEIPIGKGLSSSTADIVATSRVLEKAFNIPHSLTCIEKLIRQIEPSDGLLYDGVVAYYHREVSLLQKFHYHPNLVILAIDEGGIVDTIKYNKIIRNPSIQEKLEYENLLNKFMQASERQDIKVIGKISTRSAELNQQYNYKPSLLDLLEINSTIEGLGVICAHSGTYIGILLEKLDKNLNNKIDYCRKILKKLNKELELFYTQESSLLHNISKEFQFEDIQ